MRYEWKCIECGESVEVDRKVAEYQRPPEGDETKHEGCDGQQFRKLVTKPNRIFVPEI